MAISENQFRNILKKVIFENRLNFESYLNISDVVFDKRIENIGISIEEKPILKVNLDYVNQYFNTEKDVQWLISHELLHILFRDYLKNPKDENERFFNNIAMDAVINSYLYWLLGKDYCNGVDKLYKNEEEIYQILRPYDKKNTKVSNNLRRIWAGLYKGKLGFSDIKNYILSIYKKNENVDVDMFIGSHDQLNSDLSMVASLDSNNQPNQSLSNENSDNIDFQNEQDQDKNLNIKKHLNIGDFLENYQDIIDELEKKIREIIEDNKMSQIVSNYDKNSSKSQSLKSDKIDEYDLEFLYQDKVKKWRRTIYKVIKMFSNSEKSKRKSSYGEFDFFMPILSQKDKRAFIKYFWSPFFPFSKWTTEKPNFDMKTALYFDVSPSMESELDFLATALKSFRNVFKSDLWAFSTKVEKAEMNKGNFKFKKTCGTKIEEVFKHIIDKKYRRAVIVTDGFIEFDLHEIVSKLKKKSSIGFIISKDGNDMVVKDYGFYYQKLK